jgi:hypothetical protein
MNIHDAMNDSEFDQTLARVFSEWEAGLSAPRGLRSRLLVTAALHNDRARPEQTRARCRTSRPQAYKDLDHRLTSNSMFYASPLGMSILNIRP